MGYQIRFVFTGLCMFVRNPKDDRIDVVMPVTMMSRGRNRLPGARQPADGQSAPMPMSHFALLRYDTAYEDPRATSISGTLQTAGYPLDNVEIEYPHTAGAIETILPNDIFNLTPLLEERVRSGFANGPLGDWVNSRVRLYEGRFEGCLATGPWAIQYPPVAQRMIAWQVTWLIRDGDIKKIKVNYPDSGAKKAKTDQTLETRLRALKPRHDPSTNVKGITLRVYHVPHSEATIPWPDYGSDSPHHGDQAEHFGIFYDMFQNKATIPTWVGKSGGARGAIPYQCMNGGGDGCDPSDINCP